MAYGYEIASWRNLDDTGYSVVATHGMITQMNGLLRSAFKLHQGSTLTNTVIERANVILGNNVEQEDKWFNLPAVGFSGTGFYSTKLY